MTIDLTERRVLVTGASRGIGHAIAHACAAAGAHVAAHYHRHHDGVEALQRAFGDRLHPVQADLTQIDATERLFHQATDALGHLDTLVNNAGMAIHLPLDSSTDAWADGWAQTMALNLRAPELLCRLALPHFQEHGGGRIINIASRAAFRGDTPAYMAYAASKGGLVTLTRTMARHFGKQGVRAFTIAPGFTRTDMAQDFIDTYGEGIALDDIALDRLTEPDDLAPLVVLLASGLADHATGCTIDVNAGSYVH